MFFKILGALACLCASLGAGVAGLGVLFGVLNPTQFGVVTVLSVLLMGAGFVLMGPDEDVVGV